MMRWLAVTTVFLLSTTLGATQNIDVLGYPTWQTEHLKGKVKAVSWYMDAKMDFPLNTMEFDPDGVARNEIKSRKVTQKPGGVVEIEVVPVEGSKTVLFVVDGVLKTEHVYHRYNNKEEVFQVREYHHQNNKLHLITYTETKGEHKDQGKIEFFYHKAGWLETEVKVSGSGLSKLRYNKDGLVVARKGTYGNQLIPIDYEFDSKGNWIKKSVQGRIEWLRKITYY